MLLDQHVIQQEVSDGIPVNPQSSLRTVFANALASVSPSELTFAFQRALATYLLLTNTSDTSTVADGGTACQPWLAPTTDPITNTAIDLPGGLKIQPTTSANVSTVTSLNGVVVVGGLDRSRLHTDPMARAGGMLEASECGETLGLSPSSGWSSWGIPTTSTPPSSDAEAGPLPTYTLPVVNFQDAFSMGQAFERRLVLLDAI